MTMLGNMKMIGCLMIKARTPLSNGKQNTFQECEKSGNINIIYQTVFRAPDNFLKAGTC